MDKPFFSILIPAFNQVGLMDKCIASLEKQSFEDFEVIIVDDGSTDATNEMLQKMCSTDKYTILRHEVNKSLLVARHTAMKNAKGEYILFLDSDDYYTDDALECLHEYLAKNPVDIVRFGYQEMPKGVEKLPVVTSKSDMEALMDADITPTIWKNCYSKRVIEKVLSRFEPFYCNMSEDVFYSTLLFSCAKSFGVFDKVLYNYELGNGMSTSEDHSNHNYDKFLKVFESVNNACSHMLEYVIKYAPEYEMQAKKKIRAAHKFILMNYCFKETDMCKIVDYLQVYRRPEYRDVYEAGCRLLLPGCLRYAMGLDDDKMEMTRVEYLTVEQWLAQWYE